MQVVVRQNNIEQAIKLLKRKMQKEGIYREMKARKHYEKPCQKRARKNIEAIARTRRVLKKRLETVGY